MWSLRHSAFDALPGWAEDDHGAALAAFARHNEKPAETRYRTGRIGIDPEHLLNLANAARDARAGAAPRRFFERHFAPVRLVRDDGGRGFVTGYYEPQVEARRHRAPPFATPFLRRPPDLVGVDEQNRPPGLDADFRFARQTEDGHLTEYHDRAAIQAGALDGQGLEIAFVADPVDAFFVHIQGAARLVFDDGGATRITYDGKSGHPFTAIGRLLVERGELDAATISMRTIRQWLADHPDRARPLMEENRSYIFFRETPSSNDGPIAAAKIPLSAGRSLAVDRLVHTFATPVFVTADVVGAKVFRRLMIAQDTGSAIVGPARGDIFFGTGDAAGEMAGGIQSPADFTILVPLAAMAALPAYLHA